jgi:microsomal dipeptidase-like Zn-dependent dipeptidase
MARRVFVCLALVVVLLGAAPSAASAQCGGLGQVPCYHWDPCAWKLFGVWCMGWWVGDHGNGMYDGCRGDRLNNIGLVCAACGDTGQPSCRFGSACTQSASQRRTNAGLCWACGQEGQVPCDPGAGDPCDVGYRNAFGLCHYSGHSAEPTTNTTVTVPKQENPALPLYGYAEIHIHPFANLAFGGATTWGAPYDPRGIDAALPWCDYSWEYPLVSYNGTPLGTVSTLGWEIHGPNGIQFFNDPMEGTIGMGEHPVGGTGLFDGWPKWNSITHQQAYHKWMERAYQGGMRLMVMLAVTNEALCRSSKRRLGWSCDDMEAVDRQIAATKELEAAIDRMAGGAGKGWFRIAYSPQQARQIIRDGKMAVILGIEVDSLFGCKVASQSSCTDAYLRQQIARYYNMGVRHIYPIHGFDNAFGGAALFNDEYNYANRIVNEYYFQPYDCSSEGFGFNLSEDFTLGLAQFFLHGIGDRPYDYSYSAADCNPRGLTAAGRDLINALMDAKMIIDIDHMSFLMLEGADDTPGVIDGALEIAEDRDYPVVSSHASFNELNKSWDRNEFYRTPEQIERIRKLGGIVAPFPPTRKCNTSKKYPDIWRYIMPRMSDAGQEGGGYWPGDDGVIGIALATDMMGATQETAPRFGTDAAGCPNDLSGTELLYPFQAEDGSGWLWPQNTGNRTFNFNYDGLAHIGLVPDLLADIRQGPGKAWGMTKAEMAPIFKSAEAYIRMWERIQASDVVPPPAISVEVDGTQGPNGWYTSDVTVTWTVQSQTSYTSSGCAPVTITRDTTGDVLTCEATNEGGGESSASVTIRRDTTPPDVIGAARVTGEDPPPPNPYGWDHAAVMVRFTASDATSGIAGDESVYVTVASEGANQQARFTFRDRAGNMKEALLGGINIDRTPPRLGFRFASLPATATLAEIEAEQARWHSAPVVLIVAAEDDLSGLDAGSPEPDQLVLDVEGLAVSGSATATDRAGNSVTASSEPVKIDMTPPVVTCVASPASLWPANHKLVSVSVALTCADALSGSVCTLVEAISSELDNGLGDGDTAGDISGFILGSEGLLGSLRAERAGTGTGRVYTLGYRGVDLAGNAAECRTTVVVPHDQGNGSGKKSK